MSAALAAPKGPTVLLRAYLWVTAAMPFLLTRIAARAHMRQGADPARLSERRGQASLPRPAGRLIWIHAASVGEVLSVIDLAADLARALPDTRLLVTTMTATGARMVAARAPFAIHQFVPVDTGQAVARFLDHWQPDLAVFAEADLWPRLVLSASERRIPLALINVRPSRSRTRMPKTAAALIDRFGCITAQSSGVAADLAKIGIDAARIAVTGDLKADALPLPHDPAALSGLLADIAGRPVWIAASTHADDENPVLAAHRAARVLVPQLLLILIPRHPNRASAIMSGASGLVVAQRSTGQALAPETSLYLADTLGETGLFYRAAPLVFLGGSFGAEGGHNPFEPATLGAALLYGPHVRHFAAAFDGLQQAGAALQVASGPALGQAVARLLQGGNLAAMQAAAGRYMAGQSGARAATLAHILALLPPNG